MRGFAHKGEPSQMASGNSWKGITKVFKSLRIMLKNDGPVFWWRETYTWFFCVYS